MGWWTALSIILLSIASVVQSVWLAKLSKKVNRLELGRGTRGIHGGDW